MLRITARKNSNKNVYGSLLEKININGQDLRFFNINWLGDKRLAKLPYSIRILLENSLRNNDQFVYTEQTTENILQLQKTQYE